MEVGASWAMPNAPFFGLAVSWETTIAYAFAMSLFSLPLENDCGSAKCTLVRHPIVCKVSNVDCNL